jgi:hypothetical protein
MRPMERLVNVENSVCVVDWDALEDYIQCDTRLLEVEDRQTISMNSMVNLAVQCDAVLFEEHNPQEELLFPCLVHSLLAMIGTYKTKKESSLEQNSMNLNATAIAMNLIELFVRRLTMKEHGHDTFKVRE